MAKPATSAVHVGPPLTGPKTRLKARIEQPPFQSFPKKELATQQAVTTRYSSKCGINNLQLLHNIFLALQYNCLLG